MSIITITQNKISGALFKEEEGKTIGDKPIIMGGYIQAPSAKGEDGNYRPETPGRLRMQAVKATSKKGEEYLSLVVDGGLYGALFKAEEGKDYQYAGVIDAGDGSEFPIFGRLIRPENGKPFISLSSAEKRSKKNKENKVNEHERVVEESDDIPF